MNFGIILTADYECVDQTVGHILDAAGKEFIMLNTDISVVPADLKLAIVSDACHVVDVNIGLPGTASQSQVIAFMS